MSVWSGLTDRKQQKLVRQREGFWSAPHVLLMGSGVNAVNGVTHVNHVYHLHDIYLNERF